MIRRRRGMKHRNWRHEAAIPVPERRKKNRKREQETGPFAGYDHHAHVKSLPCFGCGSNDGIESHHEPTRARGGNWRNQVPLCWLCHHVRTVKPESVFYTRTGRTYSDLARRALDLSDEAERKYGKPAPHGQGGNPSMASLVSSRHEPGFDQEPDSQVPEPASRAAGDGHPGEAA